MSADPELIARIGALLASDDEGGAAALLDERRLTRADFDADAGVWTFGHRLPGPAGVVVVRTGGDGRVTFDLADPARLIAVEVPPTTVGAQVVDALIGPQAAALVARAPGEEAIVACEREGAPAVEALGRLAVLDRARVLAEEDYGSWPLWAAEAAVLGARAAAVPGLRERAQREAATCTEAVLNTAQRAIATQVRTDLAALLPELAPLVSTEGDRARLKAAQEQLPSARAREEPSWSERLAQIIKNAIRPVGPYRDELEWAYAGRTHRGSADRGPEHADEPSVATFTPDVIGYGLLRRFESTATLRAGSLYVSCPFADSDESRPGALWARVYTGRLELIDSAPLEFEDGVTEPEPGVRVRQASAELRVPPAATQNDIVLNVTDAPDEPIRDSRLWNLDHALRVGAAAADAQRAGLHKEAADAWRQSAAAWTEAGELMQAASARDYMERELAIARREAAETAQPFLAELSPPLLS